LQLLKNTYCDVGLLNKNCLNEWIYSLNRGEKWWTWRGGVNST
jgi:hypothetical protein